MYFTLTTVSLSKVQGVLSCSDEICVDLILLTGIMQFGFLSFLVANLKVQCHEIFQLHSSQNSILTYDLLYRIAFSLTPRYPGQHSTLLSAARNSAASGQWQILLRIHKSLLNRLIVIPTTKSSQIISWHCKLERCWRYVHLKYHIDVNLPGRASIFWHWKLHWKKNLPEADRFKPFKN